MGIVYRILRVEKNELHKLAGFGLLGFLFHMGLGIGFSSGDAAFLSHLGPSHLPAIFILTPVVMFVYTGIYSYILMRYSIDHVVNGVVFVLATAGIMLWYMLGLDVDGVYETATYYTLKLYVVACFYGLYTIFWTYTDAYFNIQDAKRIFPLFSACCALGIAAGGVVVYALSGHVPMRFFMLVWSLSAICILPVLYFLRKNSRPIEESELIVEPETSSRHESLFLIINAFRSSPYTVAFALSLFVMGLMTNMIEYQYSIIFESTRTESELMALFGVLYACINIFNLIVCVFVFNRLVSRFGVRNILFILPVIYFFVFGFLFLYAGEFAAIAAFFACHGILQSVEYNNQNLLFNAVPSTLKKQLRAVLEGLCEPLASLIAGLFLLLVVNYIAPRELSGLGVVIGVCLIALGVKLRQNYPVAMASNMRQGSFDLSGKNRRNLLKFTPDAREYMKSCIDSDDAGKAGLARYYLDDDRSYCYGTGILTDSSVIRKLLEDTDIEKCKEAIDALENAASEQDVDLVPRLLEVLPSLSHEYCKKTISVIRRIGSSAVIEDLVMTGGSLTPRDRRAISGAIIEIGETAVPQLSRILKNSGAEVSVRSIAARSLVELSYPQFSVQLEKILESEPAAAMELRNNSLLLESMSDESFTIRILARSQHERSRKIIYFILELLALCGKIPEYDLLVRSLDSTNPKVRANALEVIESSIDYQLYEKVKDILSEKEAGTGKLNSVSGDASGLIEKILVSGEDIEVMAAAGYLYENGKGEDYIDRIRGIIKPGMSPVIRKYIIRLLGMGYENEVCPVKIVDIIKSQENFSSVSLDILMKIALKAQYSDPGKGGLKAIVDGKTFWISGDNISDIAARNSTLALALLRKSMRDSR